MNESFDWENYEQDENYDLTLAELVAKYERREARERAKRRHPAFKPDDD